MNEQREETKEVASVLLSGEVNFVEGKETTTKKCRFMDKRVREISCFFVAPPRVFPLSVRARPCTGLGHSLVKVVPDASLKVVFE